MMRITFGGQEIEAEHGQLIGAEGLDASACKVDSTDYAAMDGAAFTGARMGRRDVRLTYAVSNDAEEARKRIYEVFEPKSRKTLGIKTELKDLVAEAYVGAVDVDPWARPQTVEVTLTCTDPWLYAREGRTFLSERIGSGYGWNVSNRGASVGFVTAERLSSSDGSVTAGGETAAWAVVGVSEVALDTREGSRDLFTAGAGGSRTSYASAMTSWAWPQVPHGESVVTIGGTHGTTGVALTIRERWAGI